MPIVYQQDIDGNTKLGIWKIEEDEDFFLKKVPLQNSIAHPHKRLQHLAGRYLLRGLFPDFPLELIKIADTKKPYLPEDVYHFSISHCNDYAAVIVSTISRVGIDIELPKPVMEKIQPKFLSDDEVQILLPMHADAYTAYTMGWSVKEALFKWYGDGKVDFKGDMKILRSDPVRQLLHTSFGKGTGFLPTMPVQIIDGLVLTYVLSDY